jgi:hypothetical protein
VRRRALIALAVALVVAGVIVAVVVFPTRYGCNDGAGTFTTSASVAESACGSTATRFVTDSAVVADQRLVPRAAVALVVVIAVVMLLRFASTGAGPELPDTWRPYG